MLRDPDGNEVAQVARKLVSLVPTYEITVHGQEAAEVRKKFFTPFVDRFTIDVPGPDDLKMNGDLFDHEFVTKQGEPDGCHRLQALAQREPRTNPNNGGMDRRDRRILEWEQTGGRSRMASALTRMARIGSHGAIVELERERDLVTNGIGGYGRMFPNLPGSTASEAMLTGMGRSGAVKSPSGEHRARALVRLGSVSWPRS